MRDSMAEMLKLFMNLSWINKVNYSLYFCTVPRWYKTDFRNVIWSYLISETQDSVCQWQKDMTFILSCLLKIFSPEEYISVYTRCTGHCNLSNIHLLTNYNSLCFFMCMIKAKCDNKHADMCLYCVHLSGTKAVHSLPPDPPTMTAARCSSTLGDPLAIIKNREEEPEALNEYIRVQCSRK